MQLKKENPIPLTFTFNALFDQTDEQRVAIVAEGWRYVAVDIELVQQFSSVRVSLRIHFRQLAIVFFNGTLTTQKIQFSKMSHIELIFFIFIFLNRI